VAGESADAEPLVLVAVTVTRSRAPWSAATSVKVPAVAPGTALQLVPAESHRFHWYANVGAGLPVQIPGDAVSVDPTVVVPEIAGRAVFTGADPELVTVRTAADAVWPSGFVIVTVRAPVVAPTVEMLRVTWVGSVNVTEFTVTLPLIDAAMRQAPEPGSQKPEPALAVPVSVTLSDDWPAAADAGLAELGMAGAGAAIFPTFTPQLSVPSTYSWIVQNVCLSHGSTLVIE
jgi:hypothetical protein